MNARKLSRRDFLKSTGVAGGVLVLGVYAPCTPAGADGAGENPELKPNVFVAIQNDGTVIITASRSEMGQGVRTSLPRVVADELEADWSRVRVVQAVGDKKFGHQNTDGSMSIRQLFDPCRQAGAAAREMLVQAAAQAWQVDPSECRARNHAVEHVPSGKRMAYEALLALAATFPVPENPALKQASEFRYIGKPAPGVDREAIARGEAVYGYDVQLAGMRYACVARAPVFDATPGSVDTQRALAVPGVCGVYRIPPSPHPHEFRPEAGVAVVADTSWAAIRGRDALDIEWNLGANAGYNTAEFRRELKASVARPGKVHLARGDLDAALAGDGTLVQATYETPMLAHASMEPPVAVAWVRSNGDCEVWVPAQDPQDTRRVIAEWLELDQSRVSVNVTLLGGAFGRKSQVDFILEAVEVSRQARGPIKLFWTREEDIRNDYFHAEAVQFMQARLGNDGLPRGWLMRAAYPSIDWMWEPGLSQPMPWELGMGLTNMPFDVPNLRVEGCQARIPIRIGWLRSVCNVWHAFAINSFVDEMAAEAGQDPLSYRLRLLGEDRQFPAPNEPEDSFNNLVVDSGRYRGVMQYLAERVDWGRTLPEGHFRGLAVHNSFFSYAACVVEIALQAGGSFRVVSVDTAVDIGLVVNPEGVQAQVEGASIFGLGLALYGELTASGGQVQQSNFNDYPLLRMNEAPPVIQAHIVASDAPPSGVGEPPTPVIAPALAAAMFAASGTRFRTLPLLRHWQAIIGGRHGR